MVIIYVQFPVLRRARRCTAVRLEVVRACPIEPRKEPNHALLFEAIHCRGKKHLFAVLCPSSAQIMTRRRRLEAHLCQGSRKRRISLSSHRSGVASQLRYASNHQKADFFANPNARLKFYAELGLQRYL